MSPSRRWTGAVVLATTAALGACHPRPASQDAAAVITNPTARSRAELLRVVSRALHDASVTLADDALTEDSVLIVQRTPRRDAQGLPFDGREIGRPERFQLFKNGSRCVLVHERTGRRSRLAATTCAPR